MKKTVRIHPPDVQIPLPNVKILTLVIPAIKPKTLMDPIRIQAKWMIGTLVEIEEGMTEEGMTKEGMIEEGIAIVIAMSFTGVGLAAEEEIHPIRIQATRMIKTLVESEEGTTEEGITITVGMNLTGVGLAAEEEIHPIHPIPTTMTSTDADAPARIATTDKTNVETAIKTDP